MGKALFILFAAVVCVPVFMSFLVFLLSKRPRNKTNANVIIVLGAKIHPDGTPSNTLRYRLEAAKAAYDQNRAPYIIVTGGRGKDENEPEATAMKRYLVSEGVPSDAVFEERDSKNTIENLRYARKIMESHGLATAVIATTDYHMDRARLIARRLSIPAGAAPSKPGRRLTTRILAYTREAASWCLLILKIIIGKI